MLRKVFNQVSSRAVSTTLAGMLCALSIFSPDEAEAQDRETQVHIRPAAFHLPRTPTGDIYRHHGADSFDEWGPGFAVEQGVGASISIGIGGYDASEPGDHFVKNPIVISFDLYKAPGFRAGVRLIPAVAGYKGKKGLYKIPFTDWDAFPAILPYAEIDLAGNSGISLSPIAFPGSDGWQFIQSGSIYFTISDASDAFDGIDPADLPRAIMAGVLAGKELLNFQRKKKLSFIDDFRLPDTKQLAYRNNLESGFNYSESLSEEIIEAYDRLAELAETHNLPNQPKQPRHPYPRDQAIPVSASSPD
jgi:hypothetical protein